MFTYTCSISTVLGCHKPTNTTGTGKKATAGQMAQRDCRSATPGIGCREAQGIKTYDLWGWTSRNFPAYPQLFCCELQGVLWGFDQLIGNWSTWDRRLESHNLPCPVVNASHSAGCYGVTSMYVWLYAYDCICTYLMFDPSWHDERIAFTFILNETTRYCISIHLLIHWMVWGRIYGQTYVLEAADEFSRCWWVGGSGRLGGGMMVSCHIMSVLEVLEVVYNIQIYIYTHIYTYIYICL